MEPKNYITKKPYTGKNAVTLLQYGKDEFYMTFAQGLSIGMVVNKGEHGIPLSLIKDGKNAEGKDITYKRGFTVFGLSQFSERKGSNKEVKPEVKPESEKAVEVFKERKKINKKDVSMSRQYPKNCSLYIDGEKNSYGLSGKVFFKIFVPNIKKGKYLVKDVNIFIGQTELDPSSVEPIDEYKPNDLVSDLIENYQYTMPTVIIPLDKAKALFPFSGSDIMRPWSTSIAYIDGTLAASDGHRIAFTDLGETFVGEYIINKELVKVACNDIIIFKYKDRFFSTDSNYFIETTDGQFPNFKLITNNSFDIPVVFPFDEIKPFLKLMDKNKTVMIKNGHIHISAGGKYIDTKIEVDSPINILFNYNFLLDSYKLTGSNVINCIESKSPAKICGNGYTAIVMPKQMKGE